MAVQDEFRKAAARCLDTARATTDPDARCRLLMLAQKFLERASAPASDQAMENLLDEFNDAQRLKPLH